MIQAPQGQRPLRGIGLVVAATLAFALSDVVTKELAARHPVALIVAVRYGLNLVLVSALLGPRLGAGLWQVRRGWLVGLRAVCLAGASLTTGLALKVMPVGETVAIMYLAPLVVLVLSAPVLGERVALSAWLGAAAGFAGVILILRPGSGLDGFGVAMALVNVGFGTAYHLLTRLLARTETTAAMLWHTALVGAVGFTLWAVLTPPVLPVTATDLGLMAALGGLATLGHFLFTASYRHAPAALLAPVNYLHLVWAAGLGWLVFAHVPDGLALTGMALVAGAGVLAALRQGR